MTNLDFIAVPHSKKPKKILVSCNHGSYSVLALFAISDINIVLVKHPKQANVFRRENRAEIITTTVCCTHPSQFISYYTVVPVQHVIINSILSELIFGFIFK